MIRKLLFFIIFFISLNKTRAQEKITVYCKINFYKESLSKPPDKLNIVFDRIIRFAEFADKTKIQKLKLLEESITTGDIVKYMSSLGWHLQDSNYTRNMGYTFYFQKTLNKSTIDFIPKSEFKHVALLRHYLIFSILYKEFLPGINHFS